MSYGLRLKAALTNAKRGRKELAEAIGISVQAIGDVINGKSNALTAENSSKAATFLKVPATWLATGMGEMVATSELPQNSFKVNATRVRKVFVVGRGSGGLMPERIWTDGDYPVGATDECAEIATSDQHAFITKVMGTSMIPRYNPSEYALVEPGTEPELEDDVLVRLETGQTMIKRLLSMRDGYRFGSYNTPEILHYPAREVTWVYYIAHPVPRRKIKTRC